MRDFKTDDALAARVLDVGLRRHRATAPTRDVVRALADRAELAVALGDETRAKAIAAELQTIALSNDDRTELADVLAAAEHLGSWISG